MCKKILLILIATSLCQGIAYAGELSQDLALLVNLYAQQRDNVNLLAPVDPNAIPISGVYDDGNGGYYAHSIEISNTEVAPPQEYRLTHEKIRALCATRKYWRWEHDGLLLIHEARKLGVSSVVMHKAVLEMIRKGAPASATKKDVLRLSAAYEHYREFQANYHLLQRAGLTGKTYQQMAQKLGVSPKDLNAYRVHLLHKCGRLKPGTVELTQAAVTHFIQHRKK